MLSSHVKISPLLWLHNKSRLSHQKTIKSEMVWQFIGVYIISVSQRIYGRVQNKQWYFIFEAIFTRTVSCMVSPNLNKRTSQVNCATSQSMQLKKISRSAEHTLTTILHEENVRYKTMKRAKITRQRGITEEIDVS